MTSALRDMVAPHTLFEALGVRYAGPIDGHDIEHMEQAFTHAAEWDGPIVVHVLTQKGRGYAPAEQDDIQRLHDVKATSPVTLDNTVGTRPAVRSVARPLPTVAASPPSAPLPRPRWPSPPAGCHLYRRLLARIAGRGGRGPARGGAHRRHAGSDRPAGLPGPLPGPLLRRRHRRATRRHVGRRHGHGRPATRRRGVLDVLVRSFDQANLDVGLHGCPVVFVLDRAGITGDDGPSHHGILDLALALSIPGMTVFTPSSAEEVEPMLRTALELPGPSTIRVPKTARGT